MYTAWLLYNTNKVKYSNLIKTKHMKDQSFKDTKLLSRLLHGWLFFVYIIFTLVPSPVVGVAMAQEVSTAVSSLSGSILSSSGSVTGESSTGTVINENATSIGQTSTSPDSMLPHFEMSINNASPLLLPQGVLDGYVLTDTHPSRRIYTGQNVYLPEGDEVTMLRDVFQESLKVAYGFGALPILDGESNTPSDGYALKLANSIHVGTDTVLSFQEYFQGAKVEYGTFVIVYDTSSREIGYVTSTLVSDLDLSTFFNRSIQPADASMYIPEGQREHISLVTNTWYPTYDAVHNPLWKAAYHVVVNTDDTLMHYYVSMDNGDILSQYDDTYYQQNTTQLFSSDIFAKEQHPLVSQKVVLNGIESTSDEEGKVLLPDTGVNSLNVILGNDHVGIYDQATPMSVDMLGGASGSLMQEILVAPEDKALEISTFGLFKKMYSYLGDTIGLMAPISQTHIVFDDSCRPRYVSDGDIDSVFLSSPESCSLTQEQYASAAAHELGHVVLNNIANIKDQESTEEGAVVEAYAEYLGRVLLEETVGYTSEYPSVGEAWSGDIHKDMNYVLQGLEMLSSYVPAKEMIHATLVGSVASPRGVNEALLLNLLSNKDFRNSLFTPADSILNILAPFGLIYHLPEAPAATSVQQQEPTTLAAPQDEHITVRDMTLDELHDHGVQGNQLLGGVEISPEGKDWGLSEESFSGFNTVGTYQGQGLDTPGIVIFSNSGLGDNWKVVNGNIDTTANSVHLMSQATIQYSGETLRLDKGKSITVSLEQSDGILEYHLPFSYEDQMYAFDLQISSQGLMLNGGSIGHVTRPGNLSFFVYHGILFVQQGDQILGHVALDQIRSGENGENKAQIHYECSDTCPSLPLGKITTGAIPNSLGDMHLLLQNDAQSFAGYTSSGEGIVTYENTSAHINGANDYILRKPLPLVSDDHFEYSQKFSSSGSFEMEIADGERGYSIDWRDNSLRVICGEEVLASESVSGMFALKMIKDDEGVRVFVDGKRILKEQSTRFCAQSGSYIKYIFHSGDTTMTDGDLVTALPRVGEGTVSSLSDGEEMIHLMYTDKNLYLVNAQTYGVLATYNLPFDMKGIKAVSYQEGVIKITYEDGVYFIILSKGEQIDVHNDGSFSRTGFGVTVSGNISGTYNIGASTMTYDDSLGEYVYVLLSQQEGIQYIDMLDGETFIPIGKASVGEGDNIIGYATNGGQLTAYVSIDKKQPVLLWDTLSSLRTLGDLRESRNALSTLLFAQQLGEQVVDMSWHGDRIILKTKYGDIYEINATSKEIHAPMALHQETIPFQMNTGLYHVDGESSYEDGTYTLHKGGHIGIPLHVSAQTELLMKTVNLDGGEITLSSDSGDVTFSMNDQQLSYNQDGILKHCSSSLSGGKSDLVIERLPQAAQLTYGDCHIDLGNIIGIHSLDIYAVNNDVTLDRLEVTNQDSLIYGASRIPGMLDQDFRFHGGSDVVYGKSSDSLDTYIYTLRASDGQILSLLSSKDYSEIKENYLALLLGAGSDRYVSLSSDRVRFWGTPVENKAPEMPDAVQVHDLTTEEVIAPGTLYNGISIGFSAIYQDPNLTDSLSKVEMQISTTSDFTVTDTYTQEDVVKQVVHPGERSPIVAYRGDSLSQEQDYFARLRFYDQAGKAGVYSLPIMLHHTKYSRYFTLGDTNDVHGKEHVDGNLVSAFSKSTTTTESWFLEGSSGYGPDGELYIDGHQVAGGDVVINGEIMQQPSNIHHVETQKNEQGSVLFDKLISLSAFQGGQSVLKRMLPNLSPKSYELSFVYEGGITGLGMLQLTDGNKEINLTLSKDTLRLGDLDKDVGLLPGGHTLTLKKFGREIQLFVDGYQEFTTDYDALPSSSSDPSLRFGCDGSACEMDVKTVAVNNIGGGDHAPHADWYMDRGAFPNIAYVLATENSISILNGDTYQVWDRILLDDTIFPHAISGVRSANMDGSRLVAILEEQEGGRGLLTLDYAKDTLTYKDSSSTVVSRIIDRDHIENTDQTNQIPDYIFSAKQNSGGMMSMETFGNKIEMRSNGKSVYVGELGEAVKDAQIAGDGTAVILTDAHLYSYSSSGELIDLQTIESGLYSKVLLYGQEGQKKIVLYGTDHIALLRTNAQMSQRISDLSPILEDKAIANIMSVAFKDSQYLLIHRADETDASTLLYDLEGDTVAQVIEEGQAGYGFMIAREDVDMYILAGHGELKVRSNIRLNVPDHLKVVRDVLYPEKQINVTWTDVNDKETGYMIVRSEDSLVDLHSTVVGFVDPDMESFQDKTVTAEKSYYYRVYAINPGDIAGSVVGTARTLANPDNVTVCDNGCNEQSLQDAIDTLPGTAKEKGAVITLKKGLITEPISITNNDLPLLRIEQEDSDSVTMLHLNDATKDAITITHVDNVVIEGLQVTGSMKNVVHASGDNQVFKNNVFGGATDQELGAGLKIGSSNVTIENNLFYDNTVGISIPAGSDTISILNNTVDSNTSIGISVGTTNGLIIKNNAITNNGTGISVSASSTNVDIDYNYLYGNITDYNDAIAVGPNDRSSTSTPPSTNPRYAPGFLLQHVATGDSFNSPLIDAGSDASEALGYTNFTTRTDGIGDSGTVDIGYHVVATTSAPLSAPAAPHIIQVVKGTDPQTQLEITWDDRSSSENGYKVYRSTSSGVTDTTGTMIGDLPADSQSYTDSGLQPGTTYYYQVYAYNDQGSNSSPTEGVGTTDSAGTTVLQVCDSGCQFGAIQDAITSITGTGNYEIRIAPGEYTENIVINAPTSASLKLISSVPGELVTIKALNATLPVLNLDNFAGLTLQDLRIINGRFGIQATNVDSTVLLNTYVTDNERYGIELQSGSTGWDISDSVIASNGNAVSYRGLYIQGGSAVDRLEHVTISHNYGGGVYLYNGGSIGIMRNNLITYNGGYGLEISTTGSNSLTGEVDYNNYYHNAVGDKSLGGVVASSPHDTTSSVTYADALFNTLSGSNIMSAASDGKPQGRSTIMATRAEPYPVYVNAAAGNDVTGDGSVNNPYRTVQQAVENPRGGYYNKFQKILLTTGTYIENINTYNNISLAPQSGESVILRASSASLPVLSVGVYDQHYGVSSLSLSGLQLTSGKSGLYLKDMVTDLDIQNNHFEDNNGSAGGGINSEGEVSYITIKDNTFLDNYNSGTSGAIYFRTSNPSRHIVVQGNTISGAHARGVQFNNAAGTDATFENNTVDGLAYGLGFYIDGAKDVIVRNNAFTNISTPSGVGYLGIAVRNPIGDVTVTNNSIDGETGTSANAGIYVQNPVSNKHIVVEDNTISNSVLTGSGYDDGINVTQTSVVDAVNVSIRNNTLSNLDCRGNCGVQVDLRASTNSIALIENNQLSTIGNTSTNNQGAIEVWGVDDATVDNNIVNTASTNIGIYMRDVAAINSKHATVNNNTIIGAGYYGINVDGGSYVDLTNNTIDGTAREGIRIGVSSFVTSVHNSIRNSGQDGLVAYQSTDVLVENNLIVMNGSSDSSGNENSSGNFGISLGEVTGSPTVTAVVQKNTIANNYSGGIEIINGAVATLQDNIIAHNGGYGLKATSVASVSTMSNNTFFNNTIGDTDSNFTLGANGNVVADPEFVDDAFDVKNTSPVVASGTGGINRGWQDATSTTVAFTTLYVDATSGNDTTGDGSQSKPYKTISAAVKNINNPGKSYFTTILLRSGVYSEQVVIDRPIRLQADSGAVPRVSCSDDAFISTNAYNNSALTSLEGMHDVFIQGIKVSGGKRGVYLEDSSADVFIDAMTISNMTYGAVAMSTVHNADFGDLTFTNNTVSSVGTANQEGALYIWTNKNPGKVTITDNNVDEVYQGITVRGGRYMTTEVRRNLVSNVTRSDPITVSKAGAANITDNSIHDISSVAGAVYGGLTIDGAQGVLTIDGNTITDSTVSTSTHGGIVALNAEDNVTATNNVLSNVTIGTNNYASGIYILGAAVTGKTVTVSDNTLTDISGRLDRSGIEVDYPAVGNNVVVDHNTLTRVSIASGPNANGSIRIYQASNATVTNNTIVDGANVNAIVLHTVKASMGSHAQVHDNNIINTGGTGILVGASDYMDVYNNTLDGGEYEGFQIYDTLSTAIVFQQNVIRNYRRNGVNINRATGVELRDNLIVQSGSSAYSTTGYGVALGYGGGSPTPVISVMERNTIAGNYAGGIYLTNNAVVDDMKDNIVAYNGGYGLSKANGSITAYSYNSFFANSHGDVDTNFTVGTNNNVHEDPQFVDATFALLSTSPVLTNSSTSAKRGYAASLTTATSYNEIFVDGQNGDDASADGTALSPYKTIQAAVASSNDPSKRDFATIRVVPGTYTLDRTIYIDHLIRSIESSVPGEKAVFNVNTSSTDGIVLANKYDNSAVSEYGSPSLSMKDIVIHGGNRSIYIQTNPAQVIMDSVELRNSAAQQILVSASTGGFELKNSLLKDGGSLAIDARSAIVWTPLVEANLFENNTYGLQFSNLDSSLVTIRGNVVTGIANNNSLHHFFVSQAGGGEIVDNRLFDNGTGTGTISLYCLNCTSTVIKNNLVETSRYGIYVAQGGNNEISNNTVVAQLGNTLNVYINSTGTVAKYNTIYGGQYGIQQVSGGASDYNLIDTTTSYVSYGGGANDVTGVDPLFLDISANNYHVGSGSPAIDATDVNASDVNLENGYVEATNVDSGVLDMGYHYDAYGFNPPLQASYPPSNISIVNDAVTTPNATLNLSWVDNAIDESSYKIYASTSSPVDLVSGNEVATLPANTTTYAHTGLTAGVTYFYKIAVVMPDGSVIPSSEVAGTPLDVVAQLETCNPTCSTADYTTIQAALNAIANDPTADYTLHIANGVFTEELSLASKSVHSLTITAMDSAHPPVIQASQNSLNVLAINSITGSLDISYLTLTLGYRGLFLQTNDGAHVHHITTINNALRGMEFNNVDNAIIEENRVVHNGGQSGSAGVIAYGDSQNVTIRHNVISHNYEHGLWIYKGSYAVSSYADISSNELTFNGTYGLYFETGNSITQFLNNNTYGNRIGQFYNYTDPVGTGGNISVDPHYVNSYFDVLSSSPVLGAGSSGTDIGFTSMGNQADYDSIYVNGQTGDDSNGDGSNGSPYQSLQAAVDSGPYAFQTMFANIKMAPGVYESISQGGVYGIQTVTICRSVNIVGDGGRAILLAPSNANSVINLGQCNHGVYSLSFDNVDIVGGRGGVVTYTSATELLDVSLTDTHIYGNYYNAGLHLGGSVHDLVIQHSVIEDNIGSGGVYIGGQAYGRVDVQDTQFNDNSYVSGGLVNGGALRLNGGSYGGITFVNNHVNGGYSGINLGDTHGAAIVATGNTIENLLFASGTARQYYAGISATNANDVAFNNNTVINNTGTNEPYGVGVAFYLVGGTSSFNNNTITGNNGNASGMYLENLGGTYTINGNTVRNNNLLSNYQAASVYWNGIHVYVNNSSYYAATGEIKNNTIANNNGKRSGLWAYYTYADNLTIENNTFSDIREEEGYGVICVYGMNSDDHLSVANNTIDGVNNVVSATHGYGIRLQEVAGSVGNVQVLQNNTISKVNGTGQSYPIYVYGSSYVDINNNKVLDSKSSKVDSVYGIGLQNQVHDITVQNNTIQDVGIGIYTYGETGDNYAITIQNNLVRQTSRASLYIDYRDRDFTITNNRFVQSNVGIYSETCGWGAITLCRSSTGIVITHNTIANHNGDGIHVGYYSSIHASPAATIADNIIAYTVGYAINNNSNAGVQTIGDNNIFYENASGVYNSEGSAANQEDPSGAAGILTGVDPEFANENYDVLMTSPILASGTGGTNRGYESVQTQSTLPTIYVNSSTGNDSTGDGTSGAPYATITAGVKNTNGALLDTYAGPQNWFTHVNIASGVYDNSNAPTLPAVLIDSQVVLETSGGKATVMSLNNSVDVMQLGGSGVTDQYGAFALVMDNMEVRGGRTGIIASKITTLDIDHSYINNNGSQGGIYATSQLGTLRIANSEIKNNTAASSYGAIKLGAGGAQTTISDTTISGNKNAVYLGDLHGASLTMSHVDVTHNTTNGSGGNGFGGVYALNVGDVTADYVNISGNIGNSGTLNSGFYVSTSVGDFTVTNSTISNNIGERSGLFFGPAGGTVLIDNNTVSNNTQDWSGITLYTTNRPATVTMTNNTLENNQAGIAIQNYYQVDSNSTNAGIGIVGSNSDITSVLVENNTSSGHQYSIYGGVVGKGTACFSSQSACNSGERSYTTYGGVSVKNASNVTVRGNTIADLNTSGGNLGPRGIVLWALGGDSLNRNIVENNTVKDVYNSNNGNGTWYPYGIRGYRTPYTTYKNNLVDIDNQGTLTWGITLNDDQSGTVVDGNTVERSPEAGLSIVGGVASTGVEVRNNLIRDNRYGVTLNQSQFDGLIVDNNQIVRNGDYGLYIQNSSGTQVTHNTIVNNEASSSYPAGLYLSGSIAMSAFDDNVIAYNGGWGVYSGATGNVSLGDNNTFYRNAGGSLRATGTGAGQIDDSTATGTQLDQDPIYADESYRVVAGSPILLSGTNGENRGWRGVQTVSQLTNVYVNSSTGNDSTADGTVNNPYKTIGAALAQANATELDSYLGVNNWFLILHLTGAFQESVAINAQVSMLSEGSDTVRISAPTSSDYVIVAGNANDYAGYAVDISGLDIAGGKAGVYYSNGARISELNGNKIHDNPGTHGGVYVDTEGQYVITNNTIEDSAGTSGGAIYFNANTKSPYIAQNRIKNTYRGIYIANASSTQATLQGNTVDRITGNNAVYVNASAAPIIEDNVVTFNAGAEGGVYVNNSAGAMIRHNTVANNALAEGVKLKSSDTTVVLNNLLYNNQKGVEVNSSANVDILNNTIYNSAAESIHLISSATTDVLDNIIQKGLYGVRGQNTTVTGIFSHNIVYNNTTAYSGTMPDMTGQNNNLDVDPDYYNLANFDFRLNQTPPNSTLSPAVDSGSDTALAKGLDTRTTRSDGVADAGTVDRGYHYKNDPLAPSGLLAFRDNVDRLHQVNLRWVDESSDNDGYKIYMGTSPTVTEASTLVATIDGDQSEYSVTQLSPGTVYYFRVYAFYAGSGAQGSNVASALTGSAPNAPTNVYTSGTNAQAGDTNPTGITYGSTPRFSAIYTDPDADKAVEYRIQVSTDNTFQTVTHWNVTGTIDPQLVSGNRVTDIVYAGTPLTSGVRYYWRMSFTDDGLAEGAYSTPAYFRLNSAPSASTNLYVNTRANGAQSGSSLPADVTDLTPVFSGEYQDVDVGDTAIAYELEVASDSGFSSIMYQTGRVALASAVTAGLRGPDISYAGSTLTEGTPYYIHIRYYDAENVAGAWSSAQTFTVVPSAYSLSSPAEGAVLSTGKTPLILQPTWDNPTTYEIQVASDSNFASIQTDYVGSTYSQLDQNFRVGQDETLGAYTQGVANQTLSPGKYYSRARSKTNNGTLGPWSSTTTFVIDSSSIATSYPVPISFSNLALGDDAVATATASLSFSTKGTGFGIYVAHDQPLTNATYGATIPSLSGGKGFGVTMRWSTDGGTTYNYLPGDDETEWTTNETALTYVGPGVGIPALLANIQKVTTPDGSDTTYLFEFKFRIASENYVAGNYDTNLWFTVIPSY